MITRYCHNCRAFLGAESPDGCRFCGRTDSLQRVDVGERQSLASVLRSLLVIAAAIAILYALCALTIGGAS